MFHQGVRESLEGGGHQRVSRQGNMIRFVAFVLLALVVIRRIKWKVVRLVAE